MRRSTAHSVVLAATFVSASLFALPANAGDSGASAAALLGYAANNLNVGIGARVGYTLPAVPVYFGGTFVYHLGQSQSVPGTDVSSHLFYLGAEGGFSIGIDPLVIRPYVGLGPAIAKSTYSGTSSSSTKFAFWPGVDVLLPLGPAFVGVDGRYLIVSEGNALGVFATAGFQF
jgi:hypothetical protein